MSYQDYADNDEEKGFFKRNRIVIGVGVVLVLIIGSRLIVSMTQRNTEKN